MKKLLVKNLALGCFLLCASGSAIAADVEFEGSTAINNGDLTVGTGNLYLNGDGSEGGGNLHIPYGSVNVSNGGITADAGIILGHGAGISFRRDDGTLDTQYEPASDGVQGDVGPAGPAGSTGVAGNPGVDGADSLVPGPKGDTGETGSQGEQGIQGLAGAGVKMMGSDPYMLIIAKGGTPAGDMWLVTEDYYDPISEDLVATAGDGMVSGGGQGSNWTNVGPVRGPAGDNGLQGDTGVQGERGEQGVQGDQGLTGVQGITGAKGETGAQGDQGIQGPTGATGAQGDIGDAGPQGSQGVAGPTGATGSQGSQGVAGPQGETGNTGLQGSQGDAGPVGDTGGQGIQGEEGVRGVQGVPGAKGDTGNTGPQGLQGNIGPIGDTGERGLQGFQGYQGDIGETGSVGLEGPQGPEGVAGSGVNIKGSDTYANITDVNNNPSTGDMWIVTLNAEPDAVAGDGVVWNGTLWSNVGPVRGPVGPIGSVGPIGPIGNTGAKGDIGNTGPEGSQGPQGIAGDKGDIGAQGVPGLIGATGSQGIQGIQGGTGLKGDTGEQGGQGIQGVAGPTGGAGPKGDTGNQGAQGEQGVAGSDGSTGSTGATGATGAQGEQGIQGEPGPVGSITASVIVEEMGRGDSVVVPAMAILAVEENITETNVPMSIMASQTAEHEMENILGSVIKKFLVEEVFDEINFNGHFEDENNVPVPLGNTKITVGAKVYAVNGNAFMIESISGDGTSFGAVGIQQFAGTEFIEDAYYQLVAAYGTEFTAAGQLQLAASVLDQTDDITTEGRAYDDPNASYWYKDEAAFDNSLATITIAYYTPDRYAFYLGQSLESNQTVRLLRYYSNHANAPSSGRIRHHNGTAWSTIATFDNRGISDNWQEFAFPPVTGGTLAVVVDTTVNGESAAINEMEMYEYDKTHYLANCISAGTKSGFFTASWTAIKEMIITDQLNDGEVYYTMSFDSPDDGKSYSVFYGNTRREIASSDPAVHGCGVDNTTCANGECCTYDDWYYRDEATATDAWSKDGIEQNYLSAVSKAVGMGASNQMDSSLINGITSLQWGGSGGFAANQTRFDMTVTLRTLDRTKTPTVSGAVLEVDREGWEAKVVGTGGDYSVYGNLNGDSKTVNKQSEGTSVATKIYYAQ